MSEPTPPTEAPGTVSDPHATQWEIGATPLDADRRPIPDALTQFQIVRPHARGGLGEVFVARDLTLRRDVALKELQSHHADAPDSRQRFVREAEITGQLDHPGVVPIYALGVHPDGRPYYAMRFIHGDSLQQAIARHHDGAADAPTLRQLLGRFSAVCTTIAYAHAQGVIHRDLKPANVMLGAYGETLVVDWGLAKSLVPTAADDPQPTRDFARQEDATQQGAILGTPAYMPPEQADGRLAEVGPHSDIYSLGATLYHLLTGKPPFTGKLHEVLANIKKGRLVPPRLHNSTLPRALEAVCLKAMAVTPARRYASAKELADDVERWLADEPVRAWPEPWTVRAARWMRRHKTAVTLSFSLLLIVAGALAVSTVLINAQKTKAVEALDGEKRAVAALTLSQIDALLTVDTPAVSGLVHELEANRAVVRPFLQQRQDESLSLVQRLRVRLPLLEEVPELADPMTAWMLEVPAGEAVLVVDRLSAHRALVLPLLRRAVTEANGPPGRVANAALALVRLGEPDHLWPLLKQATHPDARTQLLQRLAAFRVAADILQERLAQETDAGILQALLLGLGGLNAGPSERVATLYRSHPDAGVHAAAGWLLDRCGQRPRRQEMDAVAAQGRPTPGQSWHVNTLQQTFVRMRGPVEYDRGSPPTEPGRNDAETLHRVRIPRSFALAMREVTHGEYRRFLSSHRQAEFKADLQLKFGNDLDAPALAVNWFQAVAFCRWLSDQEELPEEEMCFPPLADIKPGMTLPANYLQRIGYRLPTEAEWEYACRGGTRTAWHFGADEAALGRYAWFLRTAAVDGPERARPVGRLLPNPFGLFDTHGNVYEWCLDRHADYPRSLVVDREDADRVVQGDVARIFRGGSFVDVPPMVRSANRWPALPATQAVSVGFRLARTLRD